MLVLILLLLFCEVSFGKMQFYDTYTGKLLSTEKLKKYVQENTTFWCAIEVDDKCDPDDFRRLDGSCNNLKEFIRGATHTPMTRLLPDVYDKNFEPRKSVCGCGLPLARKVRTSCLTEGKVPDQQFTQLLTYYWVFMAADVSSIQDSVNYVFWKPYCCTPKGRNDRDCTPNKVPDDDPVFRFTDIRCLNMTRPMSFQSSGCLSKNTTPKRINTATPLMDLSIIYGSIREASNRARLYEGGMLKYEVENGRIWPPSTKSKDGPCKTNQAPKETRCHATPDDTVNSLVGINLVAIWFWRQHNKIAMELAKLNPCWDDDKMFYTARDINTAICNQIYYNEMLPAVMGEENLRRDNVISSNSGFRDLYNPDLIPQLAAEYSYILRWAHTIQETTMKLYDPQGYYVKTLHMTNLTFNTGKLAVDNNIDYITQGAFRQACGKIDYTVHPDMASIGLGQVQRASDILTNDLAKSRYFGLQPYVKYVELCTGRPHKSWADLEYLIDPEHIEILKGLYTSIQDIDLLAGVWVEKFIKGGSVPRTLYCLVKDQLIRNMKTDRFFYERPNRPHAFTYEQLQEIRKASIAGILCDVGDKVTQIQPKAFLRIGPGNQLQNCSCIPKIDLSAWKEKKKQRPKQTSKKICSYRKLFYSFFPLY